ncbi:MAG: hypothetical protein OXF33_09415 [Rhodospirillales bacterium]|nr:hypothetical protein [Rhodospirillales bacterium]
MSSLRPVRYSAWVAQQEDLQLLTADRLLADYPLIITVRGRA